MLDERPFVESLRNRGMDTRHPAEQALSAILAAPRPA